MAPAIVVDTMTITIGATVSSMRQHDLDRDHVSDRCGDARDLARGAGFSEQQGAGGDRAAGGQGEHGVGRGIESRELGTMRMPVSAKGVIPIGPLNGGNSFGYFE